MSNTESHLISPEQALHLHPALPVWFNPQWMNAVAGFFRITPNVLLTTRNGNPAAFLPLYVKSKLGLQQAYNPTLVYYCPLVFTLPERKHPNRNLLLESELIHDISSFLLKHYKRVELNLSPAQFDIRSFKDAGLKATPLYTFIRDLHDGGEFFIDERAKLRRAQQEGYTFSHEFNPETLLDLVYKLYDRKNLPFPSNRRGMLQLLTNLHQNGLVEQYSIMRGDKLASTYLTIPDRDGVSYAWITASDAAEHSKGASLLLYWEMFAALGQRFDRLDLCGANTQGPSRLKAAMGAELKLFFHISK